MNLYNALPHEILIYFLLLFTIQTSYVQYLPECTSLRRPTGTQWPVTRSPDSPSHSVLQPDTHEARNIEPPSQTRRFKLFPRQPRGPATRTRTVTTRRDSDSDALVRALPRGSHLAARRRVRLSLRQQCYSFSSDSEAIAFRAAGPATLRSLIRAPDYRSPIGP